MFKFINSFFNKLNKEFNRVEAQKILNEFDKRHSNKSWAKEVRDNLKIRLEQAYGVKLR